MTLLVEIVGWVGGALILAAYLLVSTRRLAAHAAAFQWLNIAGAVGILINSGWHGALPSVILNIAWMAIGIATLWRLRQRPAAAPDGTGP